MKSELPISSQYRHHQTEKKDSMHKLDNTTKSYQLILKYLPDKGGVEAPVMTGLLAACSIRNGGDSGSCMLGMEGGTAVVMQRLGTTLWRR
jgi:hypothetical protein